MANMLGGTDDIRRNMANKMQNRQQTDAQRWATMLGMINRTSPQTLLGYGLGKLLRSQFDKYSDGWFKKKTDAATKDAESYKTGLMKMPPSISGDTTGINTNGYSIASPNDYTLSPTTAQILLNTEKTQMGQEKPTTNSTATLSVTAPKQTLLDMAKNTDPNVVYDLWDKRALGNLINQR